MDALKRSLCLAPGEEDEEIPQFSQLEIGYPTDVQHVTHVTFDKFKGFLGVPDDLEGEIPGQAPSASQSIFGIRPESMQCSYDDYGNSIPTILLLLQSKLYDQGGLQREGIFRITAQNDHEELVRTELNEGKVPNDIDVHALAGLIKAWFRELPQGVLDSIPPEEMANTESEEAMLTLLDRLPPMSSSLLDWVLNLMADVVEQEEANKMNTRNIAMVFAPNMTQVMDPILGLKHAVKVMDLLRILVEKKQEERKQAAAALATTTVYDDSDYETDRESVLSKSNFGRVGVADSDADSVTSSRSKVSGRSGNPRGVGARSNPGGGFSWRKGGGSIGDDSLDSISEANELTPPHGRRGKEIGQGMLGGPGGEPGDSPGEEGLGEEEEEDGAGGDSSLPGSGGKGKGRWKGPMKAPDVDIVTGVSMLLLSPRPPPGGAEGFHKEPQGSSVEREEGNLRRGGSLTVGGGRHDQSRSAAAGQGSRDGSSARNSTARVDSSRAGPPPSDAVDGARWGAEDQGSRQQRDVGGPGGAGSSSGRGDQQQQTQFHAGDEALMDKAWEMMAEGEEDRVPEAGGSSRRKGRDDSGKFGSGQFSVSGRLVHGFVRFGSGGGGGGSGDSSPNPKGGALGSAVSLPRPGKGPAGSGRLQWMG